jgi:hypothetical protein
LHKIRHFSDTPTAFSRVPSVFFTRANDFYRAPTQFLHN